MAGKHAKGREAAPSGRNMLRIIGGRWRSRRLDFVADEGLRPTSDRVRETLFNWLAADVRDARCADLFSGSGALGLEALSRGAAHCDFVDTNRASVVAIQRHLHSLGAEGQADCHHCSAEAFLARGGERFDIVFLDPPFGQGLVAPACELLQRGDRLNPGALVYIETATSDVLPAPPAGWELHRDKTAGAVQYRLYRHLP